MILLALLAEISTLTRALAVEDFHSSTPTHLRQNSPPGYLT